METCGENMGDAVSEVQPHSHHSNRGTLGWGPQAARRCQGAELPLPGKAGRLASLKPCRDTESSCWCQPTCQLWQITLVCPLQPHQALRRPQHYSHCYCHRPHCQVAQEGREGLGGQGDPGGGKKMHQGPGQCNRFPQGIGPCAKGLQDPLVPCPPFHAAALTRKLSTLLMSTGSPFSPFSPFMPGRPCGGAALHQPHSCPHVMVQRTELVFLPLCSLLSTASIPPSHADTVVWDQVGVLREHQGRGGSGPEAETGMENKPRMGLTGLPGKPISPFIPARPWGPWREKREDRNVRCTGEAPSLHRHKESSDADLQMGPLVPAAQVPPVDVSDRETSSAPGWQHHQQHCAPARYTHLLPFHIGSNDGSIWADDDAGLSLLSLQEAYKWSTHPVS